MSQVSNTLKVGDRIRAVELSADVMHDATVAALWPDDEAISIDLNDGRRIYLKRGSLGEWHLPDIEGPDFPSDIDVVDLSQFVGRSNCPYSSLNSSNK